MDHTPRLPSSKGSDAAPPAPGRIGLDGRNLLLPHGTGVATYGGVLAEACRRLGLQPEWLLDRPPSGPPPASRQRGRRLLQALRPWRVLRRAEGQDPTGEPVLHSPDLFRIAQVHFDLSRRPLTLRCADAPMVMHWTYPLPLHLAGVPNVVTIHDLIPLLQPELTAIASTRMRRLLRAAIARADRVVTVSETVRAEIVATLGVSPDRVANLSQAVDLPAGLLRAADLAPNLCPSGSFVCVGTVERRKNIRRLIEAHAASGVTAPLAIIGPDGPDAAAELAAAAAHRGGAGAVLRVAWSPRASLVRTIREARAVLFPSLAEGFGLPIVEAMALGTPVMTSRGGATEEVAGGAALLVDPLDIGGMAQAIAALDREPALRQRLRDAGLARARAFTIDEYARRLDGFYGGLTGHRLASARRDVRWRPATCNEG